jgi:hypothetical protein
MLRESALAYGYQVDLTAIANPSITLGVPGGNALLRFVDAAAGRSAEAIPNAQRNVIEELGPHALVDAAAVYGNFAMMNRIAEGTGIPLAKQMESREAELITALGIDRFK